MPYDTPILYPSVGPFTRQIGIPARPSVAPLLSYSHGGSGSAWGSGLREVVDGGFHPQGRRKQILIRNPQGGWTRQHLMSVNGRFSDIMRKDLLTAADRFGIGTATKVLKQIGDMIKEWPDFATSANVSPKERDRISSHHRIL